MFLFRYSSRARARVFCSARVVHYQCSPRSFIEAEDNWTGLVWRVSLEYWHDIFERLAPGKKILECGAGSAKLSLYMAKKGYECWMIDNSEGALEAGRKNFSKENLKGNFLVEDVDYLSFNDNTFDIVYSGGMLQHFEDVFPSMKEMIRVTKKGGIFSATVIKKGLFSCQTIGDVEKSLAQFCYYLLKGQFKKALQESSQKFPFLCKFYTFEGV